jgi:hypothetical protein
MIAVFKSAKLKLAQWLPARKGEWKNAFRERTGIEPALVIPNAKADLKRKMPHGSPEDHLLHSSLAKRIAGVQPYSPSESVYAQQPPVPPPIASNYFLHQQYLHSISRPGTAQNALQFATAGVPSSNPVALALPQQSTYRSPYSLPPASTIPHVSLPVVTPSYKSPYQLVNPSSAPVSSTSTTGLYNTSTVDDRPSAQSTQDGDKSERPIPQRSEPSAGERRTAERRLSQTEVSEPAKRFTHITAAPTRIPSDIDNGTSTETTDPTVLQEPSLEDILKQQDDEKQKELQKEIELQGKLSSAEGADVPGYLVRLATAYENSVGNLILSQDQSTLSFLRADRAPPQNIILVLPVSKIIENPIISIAGSKPMELRVKSRDDDNVETTHRFNFGQTKPARTAADVMRSKLVLARINIRVATGESPSGLHNEVDVPQIEVVKPFVCDKCGKRFKNKEGKLYHQTKSQTSCNPSFNTQKERPRSVGRPKGKKKVVIIEPAARTGSPRLGRSGRGEDSIEGSVRINDEHDDALSDTDSTDSLDSVIEWAKQTARPQRRSIPNRRRSSALDTSRVAHPAEEGHMSPSLYSHAEESDEEPEIVVDEDLESMDGDAYQPLEESTSQKRKRLMRERWTKIKVTGGNALVATGPATHAAEGLNTLQEQQVPSNVSKKLKIALSAQESRAVKAARKEQCWETFAAFLPNIETGAWDQRPVRVRKIHRKPVRRQELPEPVTFMQAGDGTWSFRPFGHGVKPIYSRPSRTAHGTPQSPHYVKRIETGFRPVLIPTKQRSYISALPTKNGLKETISNTSLASDEDSEAASKTKRPRHRERSRSATPDDEYQEQDVRISKVTGKPVRRYRRDFEQLLSFSSPSRRRTRLSEKSTEVQVLNFPEPKKIMPSKGRLYNSGLDSLPASFGLRLSKLGDRQAYKVSDTVDSESNQKLREEIPLRFSLRDILAEVPPAGGTDPSEPRIRLEIDAIAMWEQGPRSELLRSGSLSPEYRWVNHTTSSLDGTFDTQNVELNWSDDRSFDMLTLPYAELDDSEDGPLLSAPPPPQYRIPRGSLKPASQNARDLRELHKGWTTRRLTALPTDLAGLGESPEQVAKELGAQIVTPASMLRTRHGDSNMSAKDEARLIMGVCVLRTLTGGLDQNIDWVLVSTLFNSYSMNSLSKRWTALYQKKRVVIEKLVMDFQEAFLLAYQKDELPPIDYDNLVAYDWGSLVDWAMKKVDMALGSKTIDLPDTRERLDKMYHVRENNFENARQEGFFSLTNPVYKRMELASSVPNTLPAIMLPEHKCANDIKIDTLTLVKSWVRAAALTPDEVWDPYIIKRMFKSLNDPLREDKKGNDPGVKRLVEDAAEILKNEKVLMQKNRGRITPDRSYEPTDVFFSGLRKHVTVQQFVEAAKFKRYLDEEFSSGTDCVRSDYMANEGTLMCVTHLQAHGRIRMKAVGVPMDKFGLMDGNYETRKIPKEKFRFDMDIYPTAKYVYDSDNEVLQRLRDCEPPRGSELGELPVWYGIGDELITSLWHRVLVAFTGTIALRAGCPIGSLKSIFKPTLEEWEIWRLLEWGLSVGLFERLHELVGGWTAGEWWWLIVGWYCSGEV